jgi:hypothetical protein
MANYQSSPTETSIQDPVRATLLEEKKKSSTTKRQPLKQRNTVETTQLESLHDRVVLVQRWEQGDLCPLTKLPRTVEVQVYKKETFSCLC